MFTPTRTFFSLRVIVGPGNKITSYIFRMFCQLKAVIHDPTNRIRFVEIMLHTKKEIDTCVGDTRIRFFNFSLLISNQKQFDWLKQQKQFHWIKSIQLIEKVEQLFKNRIRHIGSC